MSQSVTMPSSLTLAALLYRLSRLGWAQVDLDRLTRVYETFQSRTGTLIYGNYFNRDFKAIRRELESDLRDLELRGLARRSVSRVHLTMPGAKSASTLQIPPELKGLVAAAEEAFPKRTTP